MALKTRKKRIEAAATSPRRKAKFQADLAPAEDRSVRLLKEELQLSSNTDLHEVAGARRRVGTVEGYNRRPRFGDAHTHNVTATIGGVDGASSAMATNRC
jgi:hypothetical protein